MILAIFCDAHGTLLSKEHPGRELGYLSRVFPSRFGPCHRAFLLNARRHTNGEIPLREMLALNYREWELAVDGLSNSELLQHCARFTATYPSVFGERIALPGAWEFLELYRRMGYLVALITACPRQLVFHPARNLGVDVLYAADVLKEGDTLVGKMKTRLEEDSGKGEVVRKIADEHGIDLVGSDAIGDSVNDFSMFDAVGGRRFFLRGEGPLGPAEASGNGYTRIGGLAEGVLLVNNSHGDRHGPFPPPGSGEAINRGLRSPVKIGIGRPSSL